MDADGGLPAGLVGSHLVQHLKDGRDGLWHAVIRPRDVMQLFQGPVTLENAVFNRNAETSDDVVMSQHPFLTLMLMP